MAIIVAPTAPTAADSVGVAIPVKIDPKTTIIKIKGDNIIFSNWKKLISVFETLSS